LTIAEEMQAAVIKQRLTEASSGGLARAASNHASQLGHPCLRKLYYDRTAAQLRPAPNQRSAFTWRLGKLLEMEARHELERVGYEVIAPQREFRSSMENIVGSVDGIVSKGGKGYPLEIKSVSGLDWPSLTSIQAMTGSSHWWHRLYPAQLNLYMYLAKDEYDQGLFYLKCKQTGQPRVLLMDFDWDLADRCLKAAETVNMHVELGEPPARAPFDTKVCGMCDFRQTICAPPQPLPERMDDPELIAFLEERERLKEASAAYKKAQDRMKQQFPEQAIVEVGPFEVRVTKTKKGLMRKVKRLMEESPVA
jgi:hypothetical protein